MRRRWNSANARPTANQEGGLAGRSASVELLDASDRTTTRTQEYSKPLCVDVGFEQNEQSTVGSWNAGSPMDDLPCTSTGSGCLNPVIPGDACASSKISAYLNFQRQQKANVERALSEADEELTSVMRVITAAFTDEFGETNLLADVVVLRAECQQLYEHLEELKKSRHSRRNFCFGFLNPSNGRGDFTSYGSRTVPRQFWLCERCGQMSHQSKTRCSHCSRAKSDNWSAGSSERSSVVAESDDWMIVERCTEPGSAPQ